MSSSEGDEVNRREVAYRLFAAEFEDADYSYAESDEERAPNYVVTPTGARVNRVFVVGVLTEVEQVSEDVVRARVVDPTGAFVVYAGQYQPEALAALESADTPSFVAVTGKARTFQPEDADVVYTSIRPEEVSEVDAETRDRWVVSTAEQTVDRVATMAAAHQRVERDDNLREVLESAGVQPGLAAGIPLALDHYGTTPAYLDAVRELALDAARVVARERDEVGDLSVSPTDEGDADLGFAADLDVRKTTASSSAAHQNAERSEDVESEPDAEPAETDAETADAEAEAADETEAELEDELEAEAEAEPETESEPEPEPAEAQAAAGGAEAESAEPEAEGESEPEAEAETEPEPETETTPNAETPESDEVAAEAAPEGEEAAADGEMYELSEEERQEVKENYDVGFSTGTEVPDAGESDIDAPEPDEEGAESAESAEAEAEAAETEPEDDDLGDFDAEDEAFDESQDEDADDLDDFTENEYDESEEDSEDSEAAAMDLDLEDYVVELMDELDDGDGALRENVVATAADERDADEGEIEDAIQEALMSGRCYESGDDHLKAI